MGLVEEVREEDSWLSECDRRLLADPETFANPSDPRRTGVKKKRARAIAGAGSGGSWPGCLRPSNHIGSVHLSGVESLSRRYRMALSK